MTRKTITGVLLDEHTALSLTEFSRACHTSSDWVIELVDEGVLDPVGTGPGHWRFSGASLKKAHTAGRLQQDFDINLSGVALVLELIEEVEALRQRLCRLETNDFS